MATVPDSPADAAQPTFVERVQKFVWLSSGMFSIAALGLAFTGYFSLGAHERAATNFVAAVVSSALFGVTSILKFGPASD